MNKEHKKLWKLSVTCVTAVDGADTEKKKHYRCVFKLLPTLHTHTSSRHLYLTDVDIGNQIFQFNNQS